MLGGLPNEEVAEPDKGLMLRTIEPPTRAAC